MIVIDASSLAKYLLRERNWEVIENYLVKTTYSIDHILKEVSNTIWKHVVIYRRIEPDPGLFSYLSIWDILETMGTICIFGNLFILVLLSL